MANSPQSLKRARQAEKRRRQNQGVGTKFRTMLKRAVAASPETASADFSAMQSAADSAARKGLIHPRKAARLKKRVNNTIRKKAALASSAAASTSSAQPSDSKKQPAAS